MKHLVTKRASLSKVLLAIFLFAAVPTAYAAVSAESANTGAFIKSSAIGIPVEFTKDEFVEKVGSESPLEGILLASLPSGETGSLLLGDRTLYAGEAVVTEMLDDLRFVSATNEEQSASFEFVPVFSSGNGPITTVEIHLTNRENRAPTVLAAEFETIKNVALKGTFCGEDADGDEMTYQIVQAPKKGIVDVCEDDPGTFLYTPNKNKTGTDSFTYIAVDAMGAASEEAKIEISIRKKAAKVTYADMSRHPSHLSAILLAENDIFTGECLGESYFFSPDKPVSRGEFVAMVLKVTGTEVISPVTRTGFADDSDTPAWLKPYLSTALKNGIITGAVTDDGRAVFRADAPLTRAEAATVLNNALELKSEVGVLSSFVNDAYPAWAADALRNVAASGILKSDGVVSDVMAEVTRAEAADMLREVIRLDSAKPSGLLSWAFS